MGGILEFGAKKLQERCQDIPGISIIRSHRSLYNLYCLNKHQYRRKMKNNTR